MDTRFWGPSGWRLLHQITFAYEPKTQKDVVRQLFENLPYVLPCKFCRAHLTEHMMKEPSEKAFESRESLTKWFYEIHNLVNAKLKAQGIPTQPDPTFASVKKFYEENLSYGCTQTYFPGWEFLFSIAETHPLSKESMNASPLPDAPKRTSGMSDAELNQYNLLTPRERFVFYKKFWEAICKSLPFEEWRTLWNRLEKKYDLEKHFDTRWSLVRCLWKIRCEMENEFELQNTTKFGELCDVLSYHRSGCGKSKKGVTCRRKMRAVRRSKTLKA